MCRGLRRSFVVLSILVLPLSASGESVGWLADATTAQFPNRAASGTVHGSRFEMQRAEITGGETKGADGKPYDHGTYFIHLRSGKEFFADKEFTIFVATKLGEKLDGKAYTLKIGGNFAQTVKVKVGNVTYPAIQGVHMSYTVPGKSLPETEMFMDKATLRLEFGRSSGGKLPGRIYLCVQDKAKSFVAGTFTLVPPKS